MDKIKNESERKRPSEPARGLLFELENVALNGRQIAYETLSALLEERDIRLTPALFSRYVVDAFVKAYLPSLLKAAGKGRLSEEKLAAEITEKLNAAMAGSERKIEAGLKKLLDACRKKNVVAGALSCLDGKTALDIAARLGLKDMGVRVHSCMAEDKCAPTLEAWLKLAREVSVAPRMCLALTTSARSCKAALAARMRPVAVPDRYSSFQDFGGADLVVGGVSDLSAEEVLALLESC